MFMALFLPIIRGTVFEVFLTRFHLSACILQELFVEIIILLYFGKIYVFTEPLNHEYETTKSRFLSLSRTGLNSSFPSPLTSCHF